MPVRDAPLHCSPHRPVFAGIGFLLLGLAIVPFFTLDRPSDAPLVAMALLFGSMALLSISACLVRYSVDADGFSWRDPLGRTRRVPWASVVSVRRRDGSPTSPSPTYVVEFADRRTVSWAARATNAEALRDRVAAQLARGAYRDRGDLADDLPERFAFPAYLAWGNAAVGVAFMVFGVALAVGIVRVLAVILRHGLGAGPALGPLAVVASLAVMSFAAGFSVWEQRHEHCVETLTLDRCGLAVNGGPAPFRAAWSDVLALDPHRIGGGVRVRVVTTAGEFTTPSTQGPSPLHRLAERVPAAVREAWLRADARMRGDVPEALAEGVYRHRMRWRDPRPWVLEAGVAFVVNLPACLALLQRRDGAPLDGAFLPAVALRCALVVLVSRAVLSMFRVTVSPEGCDWRGPRHRRRFAWGDVAAVSLPDARSSRLALRLADGTRLRCWPSQLAGGIELVATMRERLATVPRGDA